MGRVLRAISDTSTREIEAGGFLWRIRRIRSCDLAEAGVATLAVAPQPAKEDAEEVDPMDLVRSVSPSNARKLGVVQEGLVCAGVCAVGDPETNDWEECQIVMEESKADPDEGQIWVGSLAARMVQQLANEVVTLSSDDGAAGRALQSFRPRASADVAG